MQGNVKSASHVCAPMSAERSPSPLGLQKDNLIGARPRNGFLIAHTHRRLPPGGAGPGPFFDVTDVKTKLELIIPDHPDELNPGSAVPNPPHHAQIHPHGMVGVEIDTELHALDRL